ncbi:leucine-rich repeat protein 1 isoform X3 [Bubalus bubalis]|uniref:leucine-rich repeat protein 1 isoform X3 n=1 Tax=Bubalus bubalis TaxID=89462 RepID=UPI000DBC4736|nr:leucine-rich repeat protein 1 isoform X3 [Bubalus bubalis]
MKLHCEVEVVSRHLPALGLRNRGKGVRAVLSLCQQAPRTPPGPRAGGERGGRHPACLFISTLKDRRGTRYEALWDASKVVRPDCAVLSRFSRVRLIATPGTAARQAPLSMGFSRQEYWSGLPFPTSGDLPD